MTVISRARGRARVLLPLFALVGTACATRTPESAAPIAPVASTLIWKVEEGDVIKTRIFRQPELSTDATVGIGGAAFFPGLGRVQIGGLSPDSVEVLLNARYGALVRDPAVQVTTQRDITILGSVRVPGVYQVDPGMTLIGLLARAGGALGTSESPKLTLQRADGVALQLLREARLGTMELHRNDAIFVSEPSFFVRNAAALQATQLIASLASALIGIVVFLAK